MDFVLVFVLRTGELWKFGVHRLRKPRPAAWMDGGTSGLPLVLILELVTWLKQNDYDALDVAVMNRRT